MVMVCDVIRDRMREGLSAEFGQAVRFTHVDYQGTRVEAAPDVDAAQFRASVQRIIDVQAALDAAGSAG
ncbi:MAG TPA: hypothetical protein VNL92_07335 [Dehalococcoidia bacterium]|nr:hypothetical protein [Dehalococcoidia bacterium]